jgi:hypothetical protein
MRLECMSVSIINLIQITRDKFERKNFLNLH